jgi:hypothetical protein
MHARLLHVFNLNTDQIFIDKTHEPRPQHKFQHRSCIFCQYNAKYDYPRNWHELALVEQKKALDAQLALMDAQKN